MTIQCHTACFSQKAQAISNQHTLSPYSSRWAVWSLKAFILDFMSTKPWPPSCLGKNNTGAFNQCCPDQKKSTKCFWIFVQDLQEVQVWSSYATGTRPPGYCRLRPFPYMTAGVATIASETTEHTLFPLNPTSSVFYTPLYPRKLQDI